MCKNGTEKPKEYLKKHNQKLSEYGRNVVLGISILNYSRFKLEKFAISRHYTLNYNRIIHGKSIKEVAPYSEYFLVLDNNNYWNYGIKGFIFMELLLKNQDRKAIVLAFDEPYRYF